ncbi:MAG: hypothetical protein OEZ10_11245 [Gammaproteobacteria bacterium]|nr:hypothetical protein [Gammaproteobacteria bacterium]
MIVSGRVGVLMLLATFLFVASPARADKTYAATLKAGAFSWRDPDQETAGEVVEYEPQSGMVVMAFERRRRHIALGGELLHFSGKWKARMPKQHPEGELDVSAINFVVRKYFSLPMEFAPFVGIGLGWADLENRYGSSANEDTESVSSPVYQANVGTEWRWEGIGVVAEIKYLKIDVSKSWWFGANIGFPQPEGYVGLVGLSFIF